MSAKKSELKIRTDHQFIDSFCSKINPEVVLKCISFNDNFGEYKGLIELMNTNDVEGKRKEVKLIIEDDNKIEKFIHLLINCSQSEAAKLLNPNLEDLFDFSQCDPQYGHKENFSFGDKNPEEEFVKPDEDRSQSSSYGKFTMSKSPRGYCLLINNNFTIGTYKEMQRFRNIFYHLHFDVIMEKNLSLPEIKIKLKDLSEGSEIKEPEAFVFMLIGFENESGEIVDFDNNSIEIEKLTEIMDSNDSLLKDKPKVFVFNLCLKSTKSSSELKKHSFQDKEYTLICYSPFNNKLAVNSTNFNTGTKFGELLAESLVEKSYSRDINALLTRVNSKLGTNQVEWTKFKKQLFFDPKSPEIRTHLSIDSKKDFLVFTTKNLSNKKAKHVGNGINIYSDLFLITDTCIIYRGYFNKRSVKAAVKKYSQIDIDLYEDEVKLLLKLNKENPINFLKYLADISCNEGIYLATELPEQSLDIFMKNNSNKNIAENDLIQFIEHSCKGLNTLHNKNIVHSAVEPKNILISYPDDKGSRRVMLTNTGINNKNFNNNLESISWVSFEVIEALKKKETLRITEKGDIFSMGCVMYFVLSKGQYLFGSGIERFSDKSPVFETFDLNPTHIDLIKSMVNFNDSERPSIKEVLIHPTFWSSEKKLLFFTHIKNILFTKNFASMKTNNFEDIQKDVIKELEGKAQQIIGGNDWLKRLCPDVQKYEKNKNKHKISKTTEVKELINFIRNKDQHWDELKEEVLKKFGETPESYIDYFLGQNRFPSLLIHTYNAMKELKIERNLNNYYVVE